MKLTEEQRKRVEANLGLVVSYMREVAPKWLLAMYSYADAKQTCCLALSKAIVAHDAAHGGLANFAYLLMRRELIAGLREQHLVPAPRSEGRFCTPMGLMENPHDIPDEHQPHLIDWLFDVALPQLSQEQADAVVLQFRGYSTKCAAVKLGVHYRDLRATLRKAHTNLRRIFCESFEQSSLSSRSEKH